MLLTPRTVFTSGSSCRIRFTAAKVSMPADRYSSCPVEIGSVSVSKSKSTGRMPYFFVARSKMRCAIATFLSAVSAMPLRHRQHFRCALLAVFEVDRIDNGFAGDALQRFFHHIGFGAVDQDWRGHAGCDSLQD